MRNIFVVVLVFMVSALIFINNTFAAPWAGYGRSFPVPRYDSDFSADWNHKFGVTRAFMGYTEPDIRDGLNLNNPLMDPRFDSYNLIIVLNDNEIEPNPQRWGPGQTMRVYSRYAEREMGFLYFWSVSTGIDRASTKKGFYRAQSFSSRHWSRQFDAPMLWSVFFDGGKAFHSSLATDDIRLMGNRRSSHGCVHVEEHRAEELFHLVGQSGYGLVDLLTKSGKPVLDSNGRAKKVRSYKTLFIIH
jgi:hypothetical protein